METRLMKNIEKYKNEIYQLVNEGDDIECAIATVAGIRKSKPCSAEQYCEVCEKKCLEWMYSEYKEEILSDDEKDIIKSMIKVIRKLGCEVICVNKFHDECGNYCVFIKYKNKLSLYIEKMATPWFKNDKFKGMIPDKEYKLEELGI